MSYVGLPYRDKGRGPDAWDCWGGVRYYLQREHALLLPDYADAYTSAVDGDSVAAAVGAGLVTDWREVTKPRPGDLVILRIGKRPWHCAVMVDARRFLHWPPPIRGVQQLSCIERLDSPQWNRRIVGFHRHVSVVA